MSRPPFHRLMIDKLLKETHLLHGLCLLVTCAVSAAFGFYAGSSKDGVFAGNAPEAVSHPAVGMTDSRPERWVGDVHSSVPASASVLSAQETFQGIHSDASAATPASAGASVASSTAAAMTAGSASLASAGEASSLSSVGLMPEVPDAPKIMIPLIFQNVNPAAVGLSSTQVASINQMRSDFNTQLSGQQNPADPQYAQSWASAQAQLDDRLRALLGWDQFNQYQINAARRK